MNILESARVIAHALLQNHTNITDELLIETVGKVSAINIVDGQKFDIRELFEILKSDFSVGKGEITVLSEENEPWLKDAKSEINFELWNRYKLYMQKKDPSFPINDLDDFTDKILDKCVNPKKPASWDRRGMVVGHVQSGKTSNYVGLINKATDAGYKVIIVIAGTISSLRRQTQERIDSGYIGRNSSAFIREKQNKIVGVGHYNIGTDIYSLTSAFYKSGDEGDFSQSVANTLNIPIGKNPVVFVIKKNKSILENLIDWFSKDVNSKLVDGTPKLFDVPALIIDDEADAASVNSTKNIDEVKTINRLIRVLINIFNQSTFVGYTATPYANLFISQDHNESLTDRIKEKSYKIGEDLFPRDFIINIKAPSNYIGAAKIFGYDDPYSDIGKEPLPIFREIDDFDPPFFHTINKENRDNLPDDIPKTLEHALLSFILTCAIRRLRGHETKHNSMLIHVALLVKWIDRVAKLVNDKMKVFKDAIESDDVYLLSHLEDIYINDFLPTTKNTLENIDYIDPRIKQHAWADVKRELKNAVLKIDVRAVHGTRSTTNLEYHNIEEIDYNRYDNGLSVIAVGGSRLSRGITLEGLSISFYLRTTKMYDSLMQMGRWFGYRPGYVDLCRLYTTSQIFEWFNYITMATEEMRNDFDEMTITHQRPKDFRLKVRNHQGLLTITSLNKLNFSEDIEISFSGENPQTYSLLKTKAAIENNFINLKSLIQKVGFPPLSDRKIVKGKVKSLLYKNINIDLLCEFIDKFHIDQPSIKNATLTDYIRLQKEIKSINEWNLAIIGNTDDKVFIDYSGGTKSDEREPNEDVFYYELKSGDETLTLGCSVRNQMVNKRDSEKYLISKNQIDQGGDRQIDLIAQSDNYKQMKINRSTEKKGLILIYALDERGTFFEQKYKLPIIGFSIHFPRIDNEQKVSYKVNKKFLDFEDDIMDDDDYNNDF